MISTTVAPLQRPILGHQFMVSITLAPLAKNTVGSTSDMSSEVIDLATGEE